jgi:hypothetical protein
MKFRMGSGTSLATEVYDGQRCQFGITEALAAFSPEIIAGLGDVLGGTAAADAGAGAAAATLPGTGIADIVGSGAGLFGGTPGLAGTLLSGGSGLGIADLVGGTAGLGALGTATDFLAAPGASAFNSAALTPTAFAGDTAIGGLPSNVANANAAVPGGTPALTQGSVSVPGVAGVRPARYRPAPVPAPYRHLPEWQAPLMRRRCSVPAASRSREVRGPRRHPRSPA